MKKIRGLGFLPTNAVYGEMDSPVGKLMIITAPDGLHAVLWETDGQHGPSRNIIDGLCRADDEVIIVQTKLQLQEYFQGIRTEFELPLVINGTDFQKRVWQELRKIPYAETISYGEQAVSLGDKKKARAVGMANGLNPISIIIPCHRVIGHNGHLVGFGGGLEMKAHLLQHEQTFKHHLEQVSC